MRTGPTSAKSGGRGSTERSDPKFRVSRSRAGDVPPSTLAVGCDGSEIAETSRTWGGYDRITNGDKC